METLDSGHSYLLTSFDGGAPIPLRFVKRNVPKEKYPGNDSAYPGTLMQEVLRALIERGEYVNNQFPCRQTEEVIGHFAQALWLLEQRHAERHGLPDEINEIDLESVATVPFCTRWRRASPTSLVSRIHLGTRLAFIAVFRLFFLLSLARPPGRSLLL